MHPQYQTYRNEFVINITLKYEYGSQKTRNRTCA